MSLEFETVSLGEHLYIKGRIGWKGLKKEEYLENGNYKIINATAIEDDGINWNECGYITKDRFDESPEIILKEKDILISKDGTIGKIGYVKSLDGPSTVASGIFVVRNLNEDYINTDFLYHYFKSPFFKWFIKSATEGSVIPHLYQRDFADMEFILFDLDTQNKCAKILNNIDEKIRINKEINKNLEEQLSLIYDNHCVKCSAYDEGALIKTDWEKTHKCWKNLDFGNIIQIASGDRPNEKSEIKTSEFNIPIFGASKIMGYTKEFSYNEDILVIGRVGTHGVIQRVNYPCFPSDNTFVIKSNYYGFVYQLLKRIDYDSLNTGSTQPLITQKSLKTVNIVLPDENTLFEFENISKVFFDKIYINQKEITSLTRLRDILLPKLMSGEIDVSKINCDLKIIVSYFIPKNCKFDIEDYKMKTKIISKIQNKMKPYLDQTQYLKLTNALLNSLKDIELIDNNNRLAPSWHLRPSGSRRYWRQRMRLKN